MKFSRFFNIRNVISYIVNMAEIGKRVIDINPLLSAFEAQEGEVQQIIGQTGMGKTYEATRRALNYLYSGYTVYTTWRLNLPEYYDERESFFKVLRNIFLFRKEFFKIKIRENWHYVNLRDYEDEGGVIDTEKLARFLASRTDCIFMLDEGQDVFDSSKRAGQIARQSITRTRHMHKTLIIISQRAAAVDVNARANVTYFYKCQKLKIPFLPPRFRVYRTDEIDEGNNYPLWVRHDSQGKVTWRAPLYYSSFGKKRIYNAYDSWYMRQEQVRSQDIKVDAYRLNFFQRFLALFLSLKKNKDQAYRPGLGEDYQESIVSTATPLNSSPQTFIPTIPVPLKPGFVPAMEVIPVKPLQKRRRVSTI